MTDHANIKHKTVSGFQWNLAGQVAMYVSTMVGTIVLSRILNPQDFGLLGMVTVFASFGSLVVGMGIAHAVIQNRDLNEEDISSIFWLNIVLGAVVAIIFFCLAQFVADFYHQPELKVLVQWFSIIFLAYGASAVPVGILSRMMNFKSLMISQLVSGVTSTVFAIVLALNDFGVWALIGQALSNQLIYVILNFKFAAWTPQYVLKRSSISKINKFSRNLLPNQIIDFFAFNIDLIIIGKNFGTRDAGLYSRAGALVMLPVNSLAVIYNKTFFSAFAAFQHDKVKLQNSYVKSLKLLLLTMFPILIVTAIQSHEIVLVLFGEKWIDIASLVSILAVAAAFTTVNNFNDSFLISQGRTDLLLRINVIEKVVLVAAIFGCASYGLTVIATAKVSVMALAFIPRLMLVNVVGKLSAPLVFRMQMKALSIFILATLLGYFAGQLAQPIYPWIRLVIVSSVVFGVVIICLAGTKDELFQEIVLYLKGLFSRFVQFR